MDVLVAGCVEEAPRATPPASPVAGQCFIIGSSPTGEWASFADHIAAYSSGGWRYIPPVSGMSFYVRSEQASACYRLGQWELGVLRGARVMIGAEQVLGSRAAAISDPTGGTVADAEGRAAIQAILSALRGHGLINS